MAVLRGDYGDLWATVGTADCAIVKAQLQGFGHEVRGFVRLIRHCVRRRLFVWNKDSRYNNNQSYTLAAATNVFGDYHADTNVLGDYNALKKSWATTTP